MSNELLLNPFDYHPVLEIRSDTSFAVGLLPSHSSIGIVDENGRGFRAACPPAMMLVKLDIADQATFGGIGAVISQTSLEIITRVMLDFRHRPWQILRGISLSTRGEEPRPQAAYITRLSTVIEHGNPVSSKSVQFLDLSDQVSQQFGRLKQFGGPTADNFKFRDNVEGVVTRGKTRWMEWHSSVRLTEEGGRVCAP